jgi:hypothetical protein
MPEIFLLIGSCLIVGSVLLRPKSRTRDATLNLAICFALLLGLAVVAEGRAEDYYFYEGRKGELVISNKQPPPGSKIIKQLPSVTDTEVRQAQEPGKSQPNGQKETPPKQSNNK